MTCLFLLRDNILVIDVDQIATGIEILPADP